MEEYVQRNPHHPGSAGPGDHVATFEHPSGVVHAVLSLEGDRPPRGTLYGAPLPESAITNRGDDGSVVYSMPADEAFERLVGRLSSEVPIVLRDVTVSHMVPGQAHLVASTALVGGAVEEGTSFHRLTIQISGLGEVLGSRPLSAVESDGLFDGKVPSAVTVKFADDAGRSWREGSVQVESYWAPTVTGLGDWYRFEVGHSPFVSITLDEPEEWGDWLTGWIMPLHDLVTIAVGGRRLISLLQLSRHGVVTEGNEQWRDAVAYGPGVSNERFQVRAEWARPPLWSFTTLPFSPHELVRRWRKLRDANPGFVDSYLPIARGVKQTPAADLLLLCAAAEAAHTAEHGEFRTAREVHRGRRKRALVEAKPLSQFTRRFLKRHLATDDRFSLEDRVRALGDECPPGVRQALSLDDLPPSLAQVRNSLAHGRPVSRNDIESVVQRLRGLLDAQILRSLGLPVEPVEHRVRFMG